MSAGAYDFVMASNYNSRPLPAEALVHGESFSRRRQTMEDLVRSEFDRITETIRSTERAEIFSRKTLPLRSLRILRG